MPLHFLNPNYHVILIHYPLGVFMLGIVLQLLAWRKGGLRTAADWMVMLGAFLSIPAVTSGIYALYKVADDLEKGSDVYLLMRNHVWFQSCSSLLAVICCVIGLGSSDHTRQKLRIPLLLGVLIAGGGMVMGAWPGGEAVYTHGTAVKIIDSDGETHKAAKPPKLDYDRVVNFYIGGERQIHFILAGFALAAAAAALGLSLRKLSTHRADERRRETETASLRQAAAGRPKRATDDLSVIRSLNPETDIDGDPNLVPASRWWLLTTLMIVIVAASGYWIMSHEHFAESAGWQTFVNKLHLDDIKQAKLTDPKSWNDFRHFAHAVLGGAMILLALILAIVGRWAPRRPMVLSFFATLMVLVVAAQVWMGIALTFDQEGPLWRFQPETTDNSTATSTSNSSPSTPATPDATPTPTPAPTPAPEPTPAPAAAPTPSPAPAPESKPAPAPAPAPTPAPEPKPAPAPEPKPAPTPAPEAKPSPAPTPTPAPAPEAKPAPAPESTPTPAPTPPPAPAPESKPTPAPAPETTPPPPPAPTTDKPAPEQAPKPADSTPPPPPPAPSNPQT